MNDIMKGLIFCAGLAALAAPLRAGEAAWLRSADNKHVIRIPADWAAAAAVPGLMPKGIPHAFSLAPKGRAFALDIAAENSLDPKTTYAEDYFARARKLAGSPPPRREQLPDNSLFEYFKTAGGVKGRAGCRVQGVLYKYVQRYYLTFNSARACPADKDWKDALQVLARLDPDEPTVGAWKDDYLEKISDRPGLDPSAAAAGGSLRFNTATRADGTGVSMDEIAIFGCKNFRGNVYLFNEGRTAHCWIVTMEDYKAVLAKLDERYWQDSHPAFQDCPQAMRQERACDLEKLRKF